MAYLQSGQPGYARATLSLFAGAFITFAVLYTTQPIMPELSRHFHVTPAVSSLSLSVATAALAISMFFVSGLSDRWGRKRLMAVSLFSSSALSILVAISPNFAALLVLRALQGIALAGFPSIAMAYVNEEFHPKSAGAAMGLYVSGTSLGGMMGRILAGVLTDAFSWRIAILVIGVASLALAVWFWYNLPRPAHFEPKRVGLHETILRLGHALRDPALIGIYLLGLLLMGSFVTVFNYMGYLLVGPPYHLSQTLVGFIFVVYLVGTFGSVWIGRLADAIGRPKAMGLSITIALIGAVITLAVPLWLKVIGLAAFTFGFFGGHATASGWVGRLAPDHKAQASSLYLMFYYTGSSVAGAVGGLFWTGSGWLGVISMIAALLVIAYLVAWFVTARTRRTAAAIRANS